MEKPIYEYKAEKNLKLLAERGVGFEDVIAILDARGPLIVLDHPNPSEYPRQKLYCVDLDDYVYVVPFEKGKNNTISLKTIYPSRKMTRLYQNTVNRRK
jgi:hypothetical protein